MRRMRISQRVVSHFRAHLLNELILDTDASMLDIWVLDQLKTLFDNTTVSASLNKELRSEKVVFFLHLLGLDTTGHSYRPHSQVHLFFTPYL